MTVYGDTERHGGQAAAYEDALRAAGERRDRQVQTANCAPRRQLTPGQEALAEAARLEAARVYGRVTRENHDHPVSVTAMVAEAELAAVERSLPRAERVLAAVRDGLPNSAIIAAHGATYAEVQAARKQAMRGVA